MNLWIISTKAPFTEHSRRRFAEEAVQLNTNISVFKPGELNFSIENGAGMITHQGQELPCPDVLLVRTGTSTITYHTLALMRFLELHTSTIVVNSSATFSKCKDKVLTGLHLAASGVPIPKTQLLTENYDLTAIQREFAFPVVVKEINGARGNSVIFANSPKELEELLTFAFTVRKDGTEFLLQEYIHTSVGRDIRAYVVGDKVIGAIERRARGDARKANVSLGGEVTKVDVTREMEQLVLNVKKTFNLEMGGVDLLCCERGYKVCEVNLSAQFVGFEKATKINVAKQILRYCQSRLQSPQKYTTKLAA